MDQRLIIKNTEMNMNEFQSEEVEEKLADIEFIKSVRAHNLRDLLNQEVKLEYIHKH
jgi:hypothetical protein